MTLRWRRINIRMDRMRPGRSRSRILGQPAGRNLCLRPVLHNGSVRTLWEVLTPPDKREKTFRTGSAEFDAKGIGLRSEGSFVYDTSEPGKGNGGHLFGTDLSRDQKAVLIEYLKSL